ncbi:response regulator [candidate division KSB1 bacterium 4572_119]|nr:MAG: response regulator [candidate division KSB1 bacterium 4572_119]
MWIDDEIELLRPHIMFLEERGYKITPVPNAEDGLTLIKKNNFDLILLDEMLHGMDGLTALGEIKEFNSSLPVIMITKSEGELLMDEAIGSRIDDYLTKPVNPSQILLACKKILDGRKIEREKLSRDYAQDFQKIVSRLMTPLDVEDWINVYLRITDWELELDTHHGLGLRQTLFSQKRECNLAFARFVEDNYVNWVNSSERPTLSMDVVKKHVLPEIAKGKKVVFVIVDNLRVDQWLAMEPLLYQNYQIFKDYYFSILPTATPYSRNAIFSGLSPFQMSEEFPKLWGVDDKNESSFNRFEHRFLESQLNRFGMKDISMKYVKIIESNEAKNLYKNINSYSKAPLLAVVFNFIDFLAHSRSDSEVLKEIAPDESAFRSLTKSWFEHSIFLKILSKLAKLGNTIIITSDHGSIRSLRGAKVIGDRETSTNLRYKFGKSLKCDPKYAINIKKPVDYQLPQKGINTNYLIAKEDYYFVYPTDYHHYLNYYKDTFQHGGVSMEEVILPVIKLEAK